MVFRFSISVILASLTGCASISDSHYYCVNKYRASAAWRGAKACLPRERCCPDFARGFEAGYLDGSRGGDGTAPPVPPSRYWSPDYQTPEGRNLVSKWYEGFSYGATEALRRGRNYWHNVPSQPCHDVACSGLEAGPVSQPHGDFQFLQPLDAGIPPANH